MGLVSLLQKQVESRAQVICEQRNKSLPAELGKASYEVTDNGVVFIKQHFLLIQPIVTTCCLWLKCNGTMNTVHGCYLWLTN